MDFPGSERDGDVFVPIKASARCERQHEEYSLHHKVRRYNRKIAEMAERFETLHRHGKIPSFKDMAEYRKMISEAEEGVLTGGVNIILCTCNEAGSHRITNTLKPKYCIIDECAMATEPECMVPIRRAEHVVLIGDHQQLQPVIQCKEAERMGLGKSLFERYAKKGHEIHILETQYRMVSVHVCNFYSIHLCTYNSYSYSSNFHLNLCSIVRYASFPPKYSTIASSRLTSLLTGDAVVWTWLGSGPEENSCQLSSVRWRERRILVTLGREGTAKSTHSPNSTRERLPRL